MILIYIGTLFLAFEYLGKLGYFGLLFITYPIFLLSNQLASKLSPFKIETHSLLHRRIIKGVLFVVVFIPDMLLLALQGLLTLLLSLFGAVVIYLNGLCNVLFRHYLKDLDPYEMADGWKSLLSDLRIGGEGIYRIVDIFRDGYAEYRTSFLKSDDQIPFLGILGIIIIVVGFTRELIF